jgi:hypothetical protein
MMIGTPYLALGVAVGIVASSIGGFFFGKHVAAGEAAKHQLTQLTDAIDARYKAEVRIAELEKSNAERESHRQTEVREIYRAIPQIVHDPVYRNVCIDADGVGVLDRAQAAASGHVGADSDAPVGEAGRPAEGRSER